MIQNESGDMIQREREEGGREEESEYERGSSAKSSEGDLKANR